MGRRKTSAAVKAIPWLPSTLYPIGVNVDGGHFRDKTKTMKIIPGAGGATTFSRTHWFLELCLFRSELCRTTTEAVVDFGEANGVDETTPASAAAASSSSEL